MRRVGERVVDRPAVELGDHALGPSPRRPGAGRAAAGRVSCVPVAEARLDERERRAAAAPRAARSPRARRCARPRAPWSRTSAARRTHSLQRVLVESSGRRRGQISHPSSSSDELEPVEAARRERQQVRQLADRAGSASGRRSRPGWRPSNSDRSSSTACAERARLCTHSITSSS